MIIYLPMKNLIRTKVNITKDGMVMHQAKRNNITPDIWQKKSKIPPPMMREIIRECKRRFCDDCPNNFEHYKEIYKEKVSESI